MTQKTLKTKLCSLFLTAILICMTCTSSPAYAATITDLGYTQKKFDNWVTSLTNKYSTMVTNTGAIAKKSTISNFLNYTNKYYTIAQPAAPFVQQSICFATYNSVTYALVCGYYVYDDGSERVRIYVYKGNGNDRKLCRRITLTGQKLHGSGITADGNNIWIANDDGKLLVYKESLFLANMPESGYDKIQIPISSGAAKSISIAGSCLSYDATTDLIWVGQNTTGTTKAQIIGYKISNSGSSVGNITLTKKQTITGAPSNIQGIAVKNGTMMLSRSLCAKVSAARYISELVKYKFTFSTSSSVSFSSVCNKTFATVLPPMAEDCHIGSTFLYVTFESGADKYSNTTLATKSTLALRLNELN